MVDGNDPEKSGKFPEKAPEKTWKIVVNFQWPPCPTGL